MKIIDLLNKVANNEEVPKVIKPDWFTGDTYNLYYDKETNDYYNKDYTYDLFGNICLFLNNEVEIIEDKKIDKINRADILDNKDYMLANCVYLMNKINEIIEVINDENINE